jgi:hypothetical protein
MGQSSPDESSGKGSFGAVPSGVSAINSAQNVGVQAPSPDVQAGGRGGRAEKHTTFWVLPLLFITPLVLSLSRSNPS